MARESIPRPLGELLELSWQAGGLLEVLERSWSPPGPKKRSFERLLGARRGISRQVSAILGAKRLSQGSPGGSKIGSKIESGLEMAKSQKMEYLLVHENHNFKGPESPTSDPKPVQNWFQIASSTRRPSESLWRASWNALGGLRSRKKEVGNGSWAAWAQKGCQNWKPKSDPKTLQDAFRSPRGAKRLPGSNISSILKPFGLYSGSIFDAFCAERKRAERHPAALQNSGLAKLRWAGHWRACAH